MPLGREKTSTKTLGDGTPKHITGSQLRCGEATYGLLPKGDALSSHPSTMSPPWWGTAQAILGKILPAQVQELSLHFGCFRERLI